MVEGKGGRVLIVEDDPGVARLERLCLERRGYEVIGVATAEEALQTIRRTGIDLIVLDYRLPGDITGLDFYTQLKATGCDLPVILVTGFSDEATAIKALRSGVRDFVTKSVAYLDYLPEAAERVLKQVRTEMQLAESKARLSAVVGSAMDAILTVDGHQRITLFNAAAERMFRCPAAEAVGQPVSRFIIQGFDAVSEAQPAASSEILGRRVDGDTFPLEVSVSPAEVPGRSFHTIIARDVTERRQAEEALKDSEALYRSLVESLPLSIFRKDVQGRFTFANQKFCQGLSRSLDQLLGKTDFNLYPREVAERYREEDLRVLGTGECFEVIVEHDRPEGDKSYFQVLKGPLFDSRGKIVGTQGILWDVTARKQAEEELRRMAAESHVARMIQQKLYPSAAPQAGCFDIGGGSYPAQATGGDYFDFFPLLDGSIGVVVGDVSGHGFGPALIMAEARAYLRALAQTEVDVTRILTLANRVLSEDTGGDHFVTLFFGRLDPRTRSFQYASAGHPTGYLLDPAGSVRARLESTGSPLGLFPDCDFPCSDGFLLGPGELLLFLTDGVVEAFSPSGDTFGTQRALDIVRIYRHESARKIVDNLYHSVRAFSLNTPQVDDITAVVIKVECSENEV